MHDINRVRDHFPQFKRILENNKSIIYLDSAATSFKPQSVIDTVSHYYSHLSSNVHRAIHPLSLEATTLYEGTRDKIKTLINAAKREEIIFTKGTTESINLVARTYGESFLKQGDEILITEMEHHSNLVPWQMVAKKTGATLKWVSVDENGELDLKDFENKINAKTKIFSFTMISNVTGAVNPVEYLINQAKKFKTLTFLDGAQWVPRCHTDVQKLDCDFLAFSGHKMFGPTGVGILYGKEIHLEQMPPFLGGGDMIKLVTMEETTYNELPYKFEAGTPAIASVIGLGSSVEFLKNYSFDSIKNHEYELTQYLEESLNKIPEVIFYGKPKKRIGAVSFGIKNIHPQDAATLLGKWGIALRTGHLCAQPLLRKFGVTSLMRASLSIYSEKNDIDELIFHLKKLKEFI